MGKNYTMSNGIYLVRDDGDFIEMRAAPYASEDLLQRLLATHPSLVAGDQVDPNSPRRWLLIAREQGVPDEEGGDGRWSLDHLFIDQDAVPTLVEVKRATDTRSRREVVAQMLDYAANGVVYWPVDELKLQFERTCAEQQEETSDVLTRVLGADADPESFWRQADVNLRAGRIRMVFVADVIHPELQRIVEFLNVQLNPAEVLALEIQQYVADGMRTLVPRVLGRTAEAQRRKGKESVQKISVEEWFVRQRERFGDQHVETAKILFNWMVAHGNVVTTTKALDPSILMRVDHNQRSYYPAFLKPHDRATTSLAWLKDRPPFDSLELRQELLDRLKLIPGMQMTANAIKGEPGVSLKQLADPTVLNQLLGVWSWIVDRIKAS
jgi:hypothetical protein